MTKTRDRPKSVVAELVQGWIDTDFRELGGLNDYAIQRISFWISDILGYPHFRLLIDYKSQPKRIIVEIQNAEGDFTGEVPEKGKDYEHLREFLGLGEYEIEFNSKVQDE